VSLFIEILTTVTLPIVVLMALGWLVQRRLSLNVRTLSRLLLNVILPCALFHFLTSAELPLSDAWPAVWFTVLQFACFTAIGWAIAVLLRVQADLRPLVALALGYANSGNFGLPVAQLAFPADYLLHQTLIVSLHSIVIVPYGVLLLAQKSAGLAQSIRALFTSPMIIAVAAGVVIKGLDIEMPQVISHPIKIIAGAYIAIALLTLGAQLAETRFSMSNGPVWLGVGLKLLLAPVLTWGALLLTGFEPGLVDLLIVAAAAPVGILMAIFATEYERAPDVAGAMVLISTVLSPITVTAWIWLVRLS